MYEKFINDLKFRSDASACCPEALDAAIALMRAAEPKDAAAEREHCYEVACEERWEDKIGRNANCVDTIQRARAAVRAEREIEVACLRKDVEDWKRKSELQDKEIARLNAWATQAERIAQLPASQDIIALGLELKDAQAEIERLTKSGKSMFEAYNSALKDGDEDRATLATLRAAVTEALPMLLDGSPVSRKLRAALNAAKDQP